MGIELEATKHAERRIRRRIGISKSAIPKLLLEVGNEGYSSKNYSGRFQRYLKSIKHNQGVADYALIHNNFIYFCRGNFVITVYNVRPEYRAIKPKERRNET